MADTVADFLKIKKKKVETKETPQLLTQKMGKYYEICISILPQNVFQDTAI